MFRHVGPQVWEPEAATPDWLLEEGDPWVLVTCSTEYQGDETLARAAIEGLRDERVRVVVTLADAYGADLPSAPNARVERFVPHRHILERAGAVVCHGGMGIVQKSVAAGVPLAVVPFGRDQPEVARRVVECGAGVSLPSRKLTPERLRGAVREAMGKRAAAQAAGARLRASGGPERFADEAEELGPVRDRTAVAA
jgi:MGT family glycosyltransferase